MAVDIVHAPPLAMIPPTGGQLEAPKGPGSHPRGQPTWLYPPVATPTPLWKNKGSKGNDMELEFMNSPHLELLYVDIGENTYIGSKGNGMEYVFPLHLIIKSW
jgi:hypothetical protein